MCPSAALMHCMVPTSLIAITFSASSSRYLSIAFRPVSKTPALLMRISIFPNLSAAAFISALQSPSLEMSVGTVSTFPPAALIFSATSSSAFCRLALMTTFAPSLANKIAAAAPTPELPPVMTAVLPCKRFMIVILLECLFCIRRAVYHIFPKLSTPIRKISPIFKIRVAEGGKRCYNRSETMQARSVRRHFRALFMG